jgi:O-antigen/teichoic acid export membrane protein
MLVAILLTIPAALDMLGNEGLGVWLTLVTISSVLAFTDLGIGNGVITSVATHRASGRDREAAAVVSDGLALLGVVALTLITGLVVASRTVDIARWFAVPGDTEVAGAVVAFVTLYALGIPAGAMEKVEWAERQGQVAGLWNLAGSVIAVAGILASLVFDTGLIGLAVAYTGGPLVAGLANSVWAMRRWPTLRPRLAFVTGAGISQLLKVGALFLVLQLASAMAFSLDNIIVSRALGPEQVPSLAIPASLFGLMTFGVGLMTRPLWPEYTHAVASGMTEWIQRTLTRSVWWIGSLTLLGSLIVIILGPTISDALSDGSVRPPSGLFLLLGALTVMTAVGTTVAMLYNAVGEVGFQTTVATVMAITVVTLKVVLVAPLGVSGVVLGGVLGYGAVTMVALVIRTPRLMRRVAAMDVRTSAPTRAPGDPPR